MIAARNPARVLSAQATGATDCAPVNYHDAIGKHRPVASKLADVLPDNFTNQDSPTSALVIPVTLGGIRGAITARFIDFRSSFHGGSYGD